ncbi:hypothetical protein [Dactylosporangium sp. CA-092794]|uniref:hypothetical protein n=1 Tax=Dactylosporangium sp. CA-092794 TaxID=3239929 RepID=UPI003D91DDAB
MNCRTQMLLAAGVGYALGRRRKLRWAILLGAAAAAGRISGPGDILQRGLKTLGGSSELKRLTDLGGPLVSAAKDAARTAVTGQIDSVTGKLRDRADLLRKPEEEPEEERPRRRRPAAREEPEEPEEAEEERPRRRRPAAREEEDEEDEDYEEEPARVARSRPETGSRPPVRRRGG